MLLVLNKHLNKLVGVAKAHDTYTTDTDTHHIRNKLFFIVYATEEASSLGKPTY